VFRIKGGTLATAAIIVEPDDLAPIVDLEATGNLFVDNAAVTRNLTGIKIDRCSAIIQNSAGFSAQSVRGIYLDEGALGSSRRPDHRWRRGRGGGGEYLCFIVTNHGHPETLHPSDSVRSYASAHNNCRESRWCDRGDLWVEGTIGRGRFWVIHDGAAIQEHE
jgi:hypothetical protein